MHEDGEDWRSELEKTHGKSVDLARARQPGRGREAETPEQIPQRGWTDVFWRILLSISDDRILSTAGSVAFFALLAIFPAIAMIVSLYGMFADARMIPWHLSHLSGILPAGSLKLIEGQILLVTQQRNDTLGVAFLISLAVALWSANSGMAALFDALNVIYKEREKRSLLRFYGITFLVTLVVIVFVVLATFGVVVLPGLLAAAGYAETPFRLLRWPMLLAILMVALACVYRFGPSRRNAKWRWVTWGSVLAALLWMATSILFSWYVVNFDSYNRLYGSLGAMIGFMTWIWLSAVTVLLGAELNAEMEHQTARDSTTGPPKPLGSRGAHMADHVGRSSP